jgi:ParB family transcriptional regulator, chromosome partitioning protein
MSEPGSNSYQLLTPLERARYFNSLIVEKGMSSSEVARLVKRSLAFISNTIRLLKLSPLVQEGLESRDVSEGHARALLGIKNDEHTVLIYREILVSKISVRETEKMVKKLNKK